MENIKNKDTDILMDIITELKTKEDAYNFFLDVCTIKEIQDMAKRLKAAKLLNDGLSYGDIIKKVAISTATLARVNKALKYGNGGYEKVIKNIK